MTGNQRRGVDLGAIHGRSVLEPFLCESDRLPRHSREDAGPEELDLFLHVGRPLRS